MGKPNAMFLKIVLGLLLVLCGAPCFSQAIFKGSIVDYETGEAIPYATVFLANTTIGASSDEEGKFSLYMPEGNYEVIVRMLGYEGITLTVPSSMVKPQGYKFMLVAVDEELDQLDVKESRDPVWYRNLAEFKRFFLGTSKNSQATEIENELSMILDDQSEPGSLIASSRDILKINNPNLGYRLDYLLNAFHFEYKSGLVTYSGFPLFIPDTTLSRRKERKVEKNRLEAYNGSMQHFIRALYFGEIDAEGFEMRRLYRKKDPQHPGRFVDSVATDPITSLSICTNRDKRVYVGFDDYILITYLNESESELYVNGLGRLPHKYQTSIIRLTVDSLEIFENGSLSDPFGIVVEGYIGWERVAELLPIDYQPSNGLGNEMQ